MTREEAIAYIKAIKNGLHETGKDFPYRDEVIPVAKDALEMAIKALEQEPCEVSQGLVKDSQGFSQQPCDDAISRQAVIEAIEELKKIHFDRGVVLNKVRDRVLELPPVTPQPKMGRWEWNQYDANPKIGNFHCSLCHNIGERYYDYCPGCGAKMQEVEE